MKILVLRFDAPLISLGAPIIDNYNKIQEFPALSMLTGLLGNALGYDHSEYEKLNELQNRITFASRQEIAGQRIVDYQSVDLSQNFMNMSEMGWTTRHKHDKREGGPSSKGTHIRYRHYLADSIITVFLSLVPEDSEPEIEDLRNALKTPARPMFIGRKCCIPSTPILVNEIEQEDLIQALTNYPLFNRKTLDEYTEKKTVFAQWSYKKHQKASRLLSIIDKREWKNQIHCGERLVRQGNLLLERGYNNE
jgi:CRISPR system Cascade subunit CasD